MLCENEKRESSSALVRDGPNIWLVSSVNLTVMVSPSSNTASSFDGSCPSSEAIPGPALSPKLPVRADETEVDASDVLSTFLRLAPARTVSVS